MSTQIVETSGLRVLPVEAKSSELSVSLEVPFAHTPSFGDVL